MRDPRPLFFLHIPKTGGTSLRHWLRGKLGGDPTGKYADQPELDSKKPPKLIIGHYDWSKVEQLPWEVRVLVMLRDPVDQVRSHFDHLHRGLFEEHAQILEEHPTIEQFARHHKWGYNLQTQRLAGLPDDKALREDPQRWLAVAKDHLDQCYWFGVLDHMDESVDRLCKQLGWSGRMRRRFKRMNVAADPLWLSDQQRDAVNQANDLDRQLYNYALARFAATE